LFRVFGSTVNALKVIELDKAIERETSLVVEFDQAGDEDVRDTIAFDYTADGFSRDENVVQSKLNSVPNGAAPTSPHTPSGAKASTA